jgi:hypothetical protein
MTTRCGLLAALSLFGVLLSSGTALADVTREARTLAGDYFEFKEDPLHDLPAGPLGADIQVRPKKYRVLLIRPRAHFVPELLKSVEHI